MLMAVPVIALPHSFTELVGAQFIQDCKIAMTEFVNVTTNDRLNHNDLLDGYRTPPLL